MTQIGSINHGFCIEGDNAKYLNIEWYDSRDMSTWNKAIQELIARYDKCIIGQDN